MKPQINSRKKIQKYLDNMKVIMQYLKIVLCFNIFEERTLKILSDTYELKKYNSYPYIELEYSNKKKFKYNKNYYNKMEFIVEDDEKNYFDFIVLYDKDTFVIKFQDMPILFQKYDDEYYTKSVISNDYQHSIDFGIIKNEEIVLKLKKKSKKLVRNQNHIKRYLIQKISYSKEIIANEIDKKKSKLILLKESDKLKEIKDEEEQKINKIKEGIKKYL